MVYNADTWDLRHSSFPHTNGLDTSSTVFHSTLHLTKTLVWQHLQLERALC